MARARTTCQHGVHGNFGKRHKGALFATSTSVFDVLSLLWLNEEYIGGKGSDHHSRLLYQIQLHIWPSLFSYCIAKIDMRCMIRSSLWSSSWWCQLLSPSDCWPVAVQSPIAPLYQSLFSPHTPRSWHHCSFSCVSIAKSFGPKARIKFFSLTNVVDDSSTLANGNNCLNSKFRYSPVCAKRQNDPRHPNHTVDYSHLQNRQLGDKSNYPT